MLTSFHQSRVSAVFTDFYQLQSFGKVFKSACSCPSSFGFGNLYPPFDYQESEMPEYEKTLSGLANIRLVKGARGAGPQVQKMVADAQLLNVAEVHLIIFDDNLLSFNIAGRKATADEFLLLQRLGLREPICFFGLGHVGLMGLLYGARVYM
jgi:hypothetical protein